MTEFEEAVIAELQGIKQVFIGALRMPTEEQEILNEYRYKVQLKELLEDEKLTEEDKDALIAKVNALKNPAITPIIKGVK